MNALEEAKKVINNNLELLKQAKNDNVKDIENFFREIETIPLIKLYTNEGLDEIQKLIFENEKESFQNNVIEFLLRLKPTIENIPEFNNMCYCFTKKDAILDNAYSTEFKKIEINKENISEYYLFNIILVYNTVIY